MERQEGHTPEPWQWHKTFGDVWTPKGKLMLIGIQTPMTHGSDQEEARANAIRACACVNALASIPTEALERLVSLPAKERFRALSDIAKQHEMKEE